MDSDSLIKKDLSPPVNFPFPFEPYDIQKEFMKTLYETLEKGGFGIFESPTGTGKSLSLICGTLTWLIDHEHRVKEELETSISQLSLKDDEAEDRSGLHWLEQQAKDMKKDVQKRKLQACLGRVLKREERVRQLKQKKEALIKKKAKQDAINNPPNQSSTEDCEVSKSNNSADIEDEDDMLIDGEECKESDESDADDTEEADDFLQTQVIFCSRTHSQLSQFVSEIQRSCFAEDVRLVTLASRQNLCVNPAVVKLRSMSLINDRCMELQRGRSGRPTSRVTEIEGSKPQILKKSRGNKSGCPFHKQAAEDALRDATLVTPCDIEDLATMGKDLKACPYYASRGAATEAQLLVVPYNILLHRSMREATGIRLRNNVVIIDEAHNLLDTISHIHSAEVTGKQLCYAHSQLSQYRKRFLQRLSAQNALRINQLLFVVSRFIKRLGGKPGCDPQAPSGRTDDSTTVTSLAEFLSETEMANQKIFELVSFCKQKKLAQKLHTYAEKYQPSIVASAKAEEKDSLSGLKQLLKDMSEKENKRLSKNVPAAESDAEKPPSGSKRDDAATPPPSNPLLSVLEFLQSLRNSNHDGRVVCCLRSTVASSSLKYLLLNPAAHFSDIVKETRAVIVAGGTMQPTSEFSRQLFEGAGGSPERIVEFSCGHVIPPDHILPVVVSRGPSGFEFDFSFQGRDKAGIIDEVGRTLLNVCNVVPGGVVCFFPSYDYEQRVYEHLKKVGLVERIEKRKKFFRESRQSGSGEQILSAYSSVIKKCKGEHGQGITGALMFSVVGGKLSEGINFSDDLGRCIVVVGLPYPNLYSPELQAKIAYLNQFAPRSESGRLPGQVHYENLCMKAVNQSIGRAVRHRDDYASILLLDARYTKPSITAALPKWIARNLRVETKFGPVVSALGAFFKGKKMKKDAT